MSDEVWTALREYKEFAGESSLSQAARKLLRERLTELGFLNERIRETIADDHPSKIPPRDF